MRTRMQLSLLTGSLLALSAVHAENHAQNEESNRTAERAVSGGSTATSDKSGDVRMRKQDGKETQATNDRVAQAGAQQRKQQSGTTVLPVVTVLVPVAMENKADTALSNGCWAKLYGQNNLQGDSLTLVGPVEMPDMTGPFGVQWTDVDSIKAGPRATVVIYDNRNYADRAATVKSGQTVNELSEKLGFFEDVNSIRINCAGAG